MLLVVAGVASVGRVAGGSSIGTLFALLLAAQISRSEELSRCAPPATVAVVAGRESSNHNLDWAAPATCFPSL